jgi:hypothetical protein
MESVGIVNVNVQKDFLKIWYNEKKITLQDMSLTNQEGPIGKVNKLLQSPKLNHR